MNQDDELDGHEATAVLPTETVVVGWSIYDRAFWYELTSENETIMSSDVPSHHGISNLYDFMRVTSGLVDWAASWPVIKQLADESMTRPTDVAIARTLADALG